MTIVDVSPSTPQPSQKLKPLTVVLQLENTTDEELKDVRIVGERGEPIGNLEALDAALNHPQPPTSALSIETEQPVTVDLAAQASTTVSFETTTGIPTSAGLCVCAEHAVYPLFFSAHVTGTSGADQRLGVAATFVPSFFAEPNPINVSWVWPLLERPHRLAAETVFTDDDLSGSLAPAGRLSRALEVVEQVGPEVPITLVIDPELLDEIWVMANKPYTVPTSDGTSVPGAGKDAAQVWLDRLRTVLSDDPAVQVELTPYADPDIESLTARGRTWNATMPPHMATEVSDALGGRAATSTLAWPVTGAISRTTLTALSEQGVGTLILDSRAVRPRPVAGEVPPGLARLRVGATTNVVAALTSRVLERYIADAISLGHPAATTLPQLIAQLATRVAEEPDIEHALTLTPPRYVDADVAAAVRTIEDTSTSTFTKPIALSDAVCCELVPTNYSVLARLPASVTTGAAPTLDAAVHASTNLPGIRAMLDQSDPRAQAVGTELRRAVQRAASSAWRDAGSQADLYANRLRTIVDDLIHGVRIVVPASGVYTLASSTSPLPITVDNELPYPVIIRIRISTVPDGLPGFTTRDLGRLRVDSRQKRTLNIPTTTERTGRIPIRAELLTPNRANQVTLGEVSLTVRSTALGFIGVLITALAGAVLAVALLWRLGRRWRRRNAAKKKPAPQPDPHPSSEPERIP